MADDTETPVDTPTSTANMADFGQIIGQAVAAGIAQTMPPKKVTYGQYSARPTAFHPQGNKGPKLTRAYNQNGFPIDYATTSDKEIVLLNRITHSGRYINRMVDVIVNADNAEETVSIRFANKTADQRFELKGFVRNFEDMLTQIVTAQEAEDAAMQDRAETKATRIPHFGNTKATREARERAGLEG